MSHLVQIKDPFQTDCGDESKQGFPVTKGGIKLDAKLLARQDNYLDFDAGASGWSTFDFTIKKMPPSNNAESLGKLSNCNRGNFTIWPCKLKAKT